MLKGEVLPKAPVDFLSTMQPLDIVKTPKGVGTHFALRRLPLISAKIRKKRPTVRDFTGMIRELLPVAGGFRGRRVASGENLHSTFHWSVEEWREVCCSYRPGAKEVRLSGGER
jgi:hypothetical protein